MLERGSGSSSGPSIVTISSSQTTSPNMQFADPSSGYANAPTFSCRSPSSPQRGNSTTALPKVQVDMATLGPLLGYSHKPGLPAVGMGGACQCEVRAGESSKPHSESPLGVFQVRVWYGDLALTNSCPQSVHHPTHPG